MRKLLPLLLILFCVEATGQTLTRTERLYETSGTSFGTGAFTTGAFTPSNNSTLLCVGKAEQNNNGGLAGGDVTITDSAGLTWTSQEATVASPGWSYGMNAWTASVTTGVSMTITLDAGAANIYAYNAECHDFTDSDTANPVGGTAIGDDADGDDAFNITLDSAPAASSILMAFLFNPPASGPAPSVTPGTGWTELNESFLANWAMWQSQTITGVTSTSVDWDDLLATGNSFGGANALAVEILQTSSGIVPLIFNQHSRRMNQ